ncbi:MAG: hypothetical protein HYV26_12270, partial [Candidatus Hydrogenedentes bacterium]|nr:hypothetical protein [Candidatus Hydrogenedentota bacterium]
LFTADDGIHGAELWRSDGTTAGTEMVKDIHLPNQASGTSFPVAAVGPFALFRATEANSLGELWRTNGQDGETFRLAVDSLFLDGYLCSMVVLGEILVFGGRTTGSGLELWRSDGTKDGTYLIQDIFPGPADSEPGEMVAFGNIALFRAKDELHGLELWRTDGTAEGTYLVKDIVPGGSGSDPYPLRVAGNRVYFTAEHPEHGQELWVTDGTEPGTRLAMDVIPGPASSDPYELTPFGNQVFFSAKTVEFGEELLLSDGTPEGSRLVRDINPGVASSEPYHLAVLGDRVYFDANDGKHGAELWESDGTSAGTRLLADICVPAFPRPSANPELLTAGKELAFFVAQATDGGWSLWRSDGTESGTFAVSEGLRGRSSTAFLALRPAGDGVYVVFAEDTLEPVLWYWDGAESSAARSVVSLGALFGAAWEESIAVVGDALYFARYTEAEGAGLWGIAAPGAVPKLVQGISSGPERGMPSQLLGVGDRLFLAASDGAHGEELWVSEGDAARMVADLHEGADGSKPRGLTGADKREGEDRALVYFTADDGVHGPELWSTDGTAENTKMVGDVNPTQSCDAVRPRESIIIEDTVFFSADDGEHGCELWKASIGVEGSAAMVKDIFYGRASSGPECLTEFQGKLYFRAEERDKGTELFVSDGTADGTYMLEDFVLGSGGAHPSHLTRFAGRLFFAASNQAGGQPLSEDDIWTTDGIGFQNYDLCGGEGGSFPEGFVVAGSNLLVIGTHPDTGRELWRLVDYGPTQGGIRLELVKDILPHARVVIAAGRGE